MYLIIDFFRKCYQDYSSLSFHDKKLYAYQLYPFLSQLVLAMIIAVLAFFGEMVFYSGPVMRIVGRWIELVFYSIIIAHFVITGYCLIRMLPKRFHRLYDMFNRLSLSNSMAVSRCSKAKQRHFYNFHAFLLFELLFTWVGITIGAMLLMMFDDPAKIFLPEKYWPTPNSLVFWIALFPYKYINIYLFLLYSYALPFLYDWKMMAALCSNEYQIALLGGSFLVSIYILGAKMPRYILAKFYRCAWIGLAGVLFFITIFSVCRTFSWDTYLQQWQILDYISYLDATHDTLLLQLWVIFMAFSLFIPSMLCVFNAVIGLMIGTILEILENEGQYKVLLKPFYNIETYGVILVACFLIHIYTFVWRPFLNIVVIHLFHKITSYYRSLQGSCNENRG